jgi:putative transcriptional regulator
MKVLRDVREATKLLILKEITARRHSRLRTVAERLDITVQGVSEYMKLMTKEGLIRNVDGDWRATRKGVEFLQANFLALREFVESSMSEMSIVDVAAAVAGAEIKEGERVGLFMENGELVAYPGRNSSSRGVAAHDASKGEDVGVKDLEGIVRLRPGKVTILRIPSVRESGTKRLEIGKVSKTVRRHSNCIVAAVDLVGRVLAKRVGLDVDISFSVLPATLEAAQRGLDVLVLCPEDRIAEFIGGIEETNSRQEEKIAYETLSVT